MNTLLGELAILNDIQYPRYRMAFKMRKLQSTFMLEHLDLAELQEILHETGVHPLLAEQQITEQQLVSVIDHIYKFLRGSRPQQQAVCLQEAHGICLSWLLSAFEGEMVTAGAVKIALCLFCGSKMTEKAKYMFGVLANKNGTVGRDELQLFCDAVQLLASCLQELVYSDEVSLDRALSECLYHVRDKDDIEDEECDGGLQRPWLSTFEFCKAFSASPALNFLSWLELCYHLPQVEKVVHHVKCSVCQQKMITGFRYQCQQCANFSMCQMCFLKAKVTDTHKLDHPVFECEDYSKKRLGRGNLANAKIFRSMDDMREPHVSTAHFAQRGSHDFVDGSMSSLNSLGSISHSQSRKSSGTESGQFQPTVLHIGSTGSLPHLSRSPKRDSGQFPLEQSHRLSLVSTGSSDSSDRLDRALSPSFNMPIGEAGTRKTASIIPSLRHLHHARAHSASGVMLSVPKTTPKRVSLTETGQLQYVTSSTPRSSVPTLLIGKTYSDGKVVDRVRKKKDPIHDGFNQLNQRLSLEIDELMKDLQPDVISKQLESDRAQLVKMEKDQVSKRDKLTDELDLLLNQVQQMHSGFVDLKQGCHTPEPCLQQHGLVNESAVW